MATTTHSESRAFQPDPETAVDAAAPEAPAPEETAAADQAALAGFAAGWAGSPPGADTGRARDDERPNEGRPAGSASVYSSQRGIPGRGLIVGSAVAAALVVLVDFALTGGMSMFFGLWFVVICLVGAMAVRRQDLFTAGVLAPLLFGGLIAVVSLLAPSTFSEVGGFGKVYPTGLTAHAGALVAGYGVALLTVACRGSARS